jgi:hypothetical protein
VTDPSGSCGSVSGGAEEGSPLPSGVSGFPEGAACRQEERPVAVRRIRRIAPARREKTLRFFFIDRSLLFFL